MTMTTADRNKLIEYIASQLNAGKEYDEILILADIQYVFTQKQFHRCWLLAQPIHRSHIRENKKPK